MMVRTAHQVARRRRFTVDEISRMVEAGVFRDEERFELIDGEVVEMPQPGETLLAVEVADSSLSRDRRLKLPICARLGVARLWILDLRRRSVHAYEDLQAGGFQSHRRRVGEDLLSIPEDGDVRAGDLFCA